MIIDGPYLMLISRIRALQLTGPSVSDRARKELRELVHDMLTAAFTAMVSGVRNHAAEFLPGGGFCTANLLFVERDFLETGYTDHSISRLY